MVALASMSTAPSSSPSTAASADSGARSADSAWHARTMGRGPGQHVIVAGDGNGWLFKKQDGGFAYQRVVCTLRGEGQAP